MALAVLAVAVQWLLLGFEAEPLMARGRVDDVTDWATDRVSAGAALLAGIALVAVGAAMAWVLWTTRRIDRAVITTRRGRHGWTRIDRSTLEDALTRVLEAVDRRNDIVVRVGRRGRVDLRIVTPDPSAMGSSQELRDSIDELAGARNLPIRAGRITVTLPRRMTARRRVR
ncbi:MAG: hypothetical protein U5R31_13370 [Acidimicrobiia bacterium]|nr:hypothetical protein [Acidimicrobiia bacterium]